MAKVKKDYLEESIELVENGDIDIEALKKVHDMKMREAELKVAKRPSWDVLINAGVAVATTLMVMNYEESRILATKGWGIASKFIGKGK